MKRTSGHTHKHTQWSSADSATRRLTILMQSAHKHTCSHTHTPSLSLFLLVSLLLVLVPLASMLILLILPPFVLFLVRLPVQRLLRLT